MISIITETKIQRTLKVAHYMFCNNNVKISGFYQKLTQGVHNKTYIWSCIHQMHERTTIYLYNATSTVYEVVSYKNFIFDTIGVAIALQSNIPNLFRISIAYFP